MGFSSAAGVFIHCVESACLHMGAYFYLLQGLLLLGEFMVSAAVLRIFLVLFNCVFYDRDDGVVKVFTDL